MDVQFTSAPEWDAIEEDKGLVAFRWNNGVLEQCRLILSHSVVILSGQPLTQTESIYRWSAIPQKGDESLSGFE